MYDSRGCSVDQILNLALSPKPDFDLYEKKCLENQLLTMQLLNSACNAYKSYLSDTVHFEDFNEIKDLEKALQIATKQTNLDIEYIENLLVDYRSKKKELNSVLDAKTRDKMYLSLHEVTSIKLKKEDLYTGNRLYRKFHKSDINGHVI